MKAGDKVKYTSPQDSFERELVMTVLEDRGERVLVQLFEAEADEWAIAPTAVYLKSDLVLA